MQMQLPFWLIRADLPSVLPMKSRSGFQFLEGRFSRCTYSAITPLICWSGGCSFLTSWLPIPLQSGAVWNAICQTTLLLLCGRSEPPWKKSDMTGIQTLHTSRYQRPCQCQWRSTSHGKWMNRWRLSKALVKKILWYLTEIANDGRFGNENDVIPIRCCSEHQ